jgi:hypothetical protein
VFESVWVSMVDLDLYVKDDAGNDLQVIVSHHALDRFIDRYSILNQDIRNIGKNSQLLKLKEVFYKAKPYSSNKCIKSDMKFGRSTYYLLAEDLIFVIDKKNLVIVTVKYAPEYEYLNRVYRLTTKRKGTH